MRRSPFCENGSRHLNGSSAFWDRRRVFHSNFSKFFSWPANQENVVELSVWTLSNLKSDLEGIELSKLGQGSTLAAEGVMVMAPAPSKIF